MKEQIIKILNEFKFDIPLEVGSATIINADDFSAIAEKLSQLDGWVKCSERYPDKYGAYWVCRKDGKMHMEIWNGTGFSMNQKVITHWKPLPELPSNPE